MQKNHSNNGKLLSGQQKGLAECLTIEGQVKLLFPRYGIGWPAAPAKAGPQGELDELWGNTEMAAPVSTRKHLWESW
jgi:hypothetical protein